MNMQSLMAQAQKIQKEVTKAKEEIDATVFESENEMVLLTMNGKKEIKTFKIKIEKIETDDIEILEDMIQIAFSDCLNKIEEETDKKLGKFGNSLNGLI